MTAEIVAAPTPDKPPRHKWSEDRRSIAACDSPSGNDQNERDCMFCGLVRVTVHAPDGRAWREWRHKSGPAQFACEHTPPCVERSVT